MRPVALCGPRLRLRAVALLGSLLVALLMAPAPVHAQRQRVAEVLRPEARTRLVTADTTLARLTRRVPGGRAELRTGTWRAAYRGAARIAPRSTPEATARAYLRASAERFGWPAETGTLVLERTVETPHSRHLTFRQYAFGVPVYQRRVKVSLDARGRPTMAISGYAPHLDALRGFDARPSLTAEDAATQARAAVTSEAETSEPELVVVPTEAPRLAWRLLVWPAEPVSELEVLIDAHTGEVLRVVDRRTHAHGKHAHEASAPNAAAAARAEPAASTAALRTDGRGYVFDPDPLTTAGVDYGAPYVDQDDAAISALDAQRRLVDLPGLRQGNDGLYRLDGPYVRIIGTDDGGRTIYTPPAEPGPDDFQYQRNEDGFEAVNAYYHLDKSQRYVQTLGFYDRQNGPIDVNPQGLGGDDSFYLNGRNAIFFGVGGVDDAEDATVIWHEYGHALLESGSAGLRVTSEGQSLHEGWSDYWAASYVRDLVERGEVPRGDWRKIFKWDSGDGTIWAGRTLDRAGTYPGDTTCDDPDDINNDGCRLYDDGLVWATALMEVYDEVGREVMDVLNLQSHYYLSAPVTYTDAAEALLQADLDVYDGAHQQALLTKLGARGYLDATAYAPEVTHTPLTATEQLGGTVEVAVEAVGTSAAIRRVSVYHGTGGTPTSRLDLMMAEAGRYTGALPLPSSSAEVTYYVEVLDDQGRTVRLPEDAPATTYSFLVGPDEEPPAIAHTPLTSASLAAWPPVLAARVEDPLGVAAVWVSYRVEGAGGAPKTEGEVTLEAVDDGYAAPLPVSRAEVEAGDEVFYTVHARDAAQAANEASLPASGTYAFTVVAEGVLQAFDFEGTGAQLTATGAWAQGTPAFGLETARSGQQAWGTGLDTPYPAAPGRSALTLPALDLRDVPAAYLVFWHWHDLEHDGTALPGGSVPANLWDGANVKVSTDGGATWTVATPEDGYDGTVFENPANPLGGEPAFGGYSFGWRRALVVLPQAADVRVRFDLGTDPSNTEANRFGYAGWFIDDVRITTQLPTDTTPPEALTLPEAEVLRGVGEPVPPFTLTARDDTGLQRVEAVYELVTAGGTTSGTLRLEMDPADPEAFGGTFTPSQPLAPGDELRYRYRLVDVDGNEALEPAGDPLRVVYRLARARTVLANVRATGAWRQDGAAWLAEGGPVEDVSGLVLEPLDVPANTETARLVLTHQYALGDGLGGNVKLSTDDGRTWTLLTPEGGYPGTFEQAGPLAGEGIFSDTTEALVQDLFDLQPYAGQQVRLRFEFGAARAPSAGEAWRIDNAVLSLLTADDDFEAPQALELLANFPDPFATTTTISYTLPERQDVDLAVYDLLGRRVAVLVDRPQEPGTHTLTFDGSRLASGVYLLRLRAGQSQRVERMIVAR